MLRRMQFLDAICWGAPSYPRHFGNERHEQGGASARRFSNVATVRVAAGTVGVAADEGILEEPMLTQAERREKVWDVVRVSSGNFLEMYDFFVYGYFAIAIGKAFF